MSIRLKARATVLPLITYQPVFAAARNIKQGDEKLLHTRVRRTSARIRFSGRIYTVLIASAIRSMYHSFRQVTLADLRINLILCPRKILFLRIIQRTNISTVHKIWSYCLFFQELLCLVCLVNWNLGKLQLASKNVVQWNLDFGMLELSPSRVKLKWNHSKPCSTVGTDQYYIFGFDDLCSAGSKIY